MYLALSREGQFPFLRLLIKCSSNVNRASYSTTYHWVVTDSEESHHLNVSWN